MKLPGGPEEKFECPRCGGSSFGSVLLDPGNPGASPMHRYCHGDDAGDGAVGCIFDWPDEDDWKYFLVNGVKLSKSEYALIQEQIRGLSIEGGPYAE